MAAPPPAQKNVVANPAIGCVFFQNKQLCYNYKTNQWTLLTAYNDGAYVGTNNSTRNIGRLIISGTAVDLQFGGTVEQTAIWETGERDADGFRSLVNGIKPLINGGTTTVRVGSREDLDDAVTYSTVTSLNSRTGFADIRQEGLYNRAEVTSVGFTTALGIDFDAVPTGEL